MVKTKLLFSGVVLFVLLAALSVTPVTGQEEPNTCIILEKTGPATAMPGEQIAYHFKLVNCGDFPFYAGAQVYDPLFGTAPIWSGDMQPGQVLEGDKTYTLPADQCGPFTNSAWAVGHPWDESIPDYLDDVYDYADWTIDVICEPTPFCETDMIAGQNWDVPAGVVTISNDATNLYVKFQPTEFWTLEDTHLYVGTTPPKKSAPGQFPYSGQTEYVIPLADLGADTVYIAAHAVVIGQSGQPETAWADTYGIPFGNSWAMYVEYTIDSGCVQP